LNKELSRVRAKEVIELFKKFTVTRAGNGVNYQNVIYIYEGKGERNAESFNKRLHRG
jgi:hypothetical protein